MASFVDVCRFTAVSSGTGDFVVSAAVTGYQTPASAGAVNGAIYRYRAESADLSEWEVGYGAYTSGTTTLARTTVLFSSTGSKINFSAAPQVAIVFLAEDFKATGQIPGTATNDDASSGNIGEYKQSAGALTTATVTISNASPAVITQTGHGFTAAKNNYSALFFTTTGTLPTGLSPSTNYFMVVIDANTYYVATTVANAIAGTYINTSSAGSGTHTVDHRALLTTVTTQDVAGLSLTAGDWDVAAMSYIQGAGSPSVSYFATDVTVTTSTTPANFGLFAQIVPKDPLTIVHNLSISQYRVSLSSTTTYFLTVTASFSGGTSVRAGGFLSARRVR